MIKGLTKKVLFKASNQIISCLCAYFASLRLRWKISNRRRGGAKEALKTKNIWPIFFTSYFLVTPEVLNLSFDLSLRRGTMLKIFIATRSLLLRIRAGNELNAGADLMAGLTFIAPLRRRAGDEVNAGRMRLSVFKTSPQSSIFEYQKLYDF